jgi:hypothetical protein
MKPAPERRPGSQPPSPEPGRLATGPAPGRGLGLVGGGVLAISLSMALLVGMQLGGLPWRMRREFLRLQGALVGGVVGLMVGYVIGRTSSDPPA